MLKSENDFSNAISKLYKGMRKLDFTHIKIFTLIKLNSSLSTQSKILGIPSSSKSFRLKRKLKLNPCTLLLSLQSSMGLNLGLFNNFTAICSQLSTEIVPD